MKSFLEMSAIILMVSINTAYGYQNVIDAGYYKKTHGVSECPSSIKIETIKKDVTVFNERGYNFLSFYNINGRPVDANKDAGSKLQLKSELYGNKIEEYSRRCSGWIFFTCEEWRYTSSIEALGKGKIALESYFPGANVTLCEYKKTP